MNTRLRSLHGSSFFSAIPFHLQAPLTVTDTTSVTSGALHAPYVSHGVLYPGIVSNFTKSNFLGSTVGKRQQTNLVDCIIKVLFEGNSAMGFNSPKNFVVPGRLSFSMKEDEVTSSEETAKERTASSDGELNDKWHKSPYNNNYM